MSIDMRALACLLFAAVAATPANGQYDEPYRPQYHYSPARNWMNDPNGLVFFEGEYHLFYQYNPFGDRWGHMSWGHAVGADLVHWRELPVALSEENGIMIFSGSAVVDANNSSGLCSAGACLVAIYTGHTSSRQTQNIAFSNDRGRTWTKYRGNPVIDLGMKDFRDPKVFWYPPTRRWIMAVALPKQKKVRFFGSTDLRHWTALSDFGPAGATGGDWECPDLFPLQVEGEDGETHWLLSVNVNPGGPYGGSANQYFVGDFNGERFTSMNDSAEALWADHGKDFYASQSYNGISTSDGRRIWIGWLSNWQYAREEPTAPWRCMQSIPRTLKLVKSANAALRLAQQPVAELRRLREAGIHVLNSDAAGANRAVRGFKSESYEIAAEFDSASDVHFDVRAGAADKTIIGYSATAGELFIDRTQSGNTAFSKEFPGRHAGPILARARRMKIDIYVDRSSVEVFGGDGDVVLSDRIFPGRGDNTLHIEGNARRLSLNVWNLKSVWR
jgi:fructan beta-fructosidase